MGKIAIFFLFIMIILIYPVFLIKPIKKIDFNIEENNISKINILDGAFFQYNNNLIREGNFSLFKIYKNFYIAENFNLNDLIKKELVKIKNIKLIENKLYGNKVYYHNDNYDFYSNFVVYDLKTKEFKGDKFLFYGQDFKGRGRDFLIDKFRNINAKNIIFSLKVNK